MNYFATAAAFLVAFVYIRFLRKLDLFEQEHPFYSVLAFVMGCLFLFLIFPLHNLLPELRNIQEGESFSERLQFHFQAVALFEEAVKILPFLLLLPFAKPINEPFDYIKYASVGAMGFAAVENVQYFNEYTVRIIEGRAFYTAVMHMFTSSLIAYLWMITKYRTKLPPALSLIPGFLIACMVHATYNALMSGVITYTVGIVFTITLLTFWGRMMNNALNLSPFFSEETARKGAGLAAIRLLSGWAAIFFFAAAALASTEGFSEAYVFVREGFVFGAISGLGLYFALGRPKLERGVLRSIIRF